MLPKMHAYPRASTSDHGVGDICSRSYVGRGAIHYFCSLLYGHPAPALGISQAILLGTVSGGINLIARTPWVVEIAALDA